MDLMAKKKPSESPRIRKRPGKRQLTFEFPDALDDALESCAERDLRSKKAVMMLALQEYLAQQGLWPPDPAK